MAKTEVRARLAVPLLVVSTLHGGASSAEVRLATRDVKPEATIAKQTEKQVIAEAPTPNKPKKRIRDYIITGLSSATTRYTTRAEIDEKVKPQPQAPEIPVITQAPIPIIERTVIPVWRYNELGTKPEASKKTPTWTVQESLARRTKLASIHKPSPFSVIKQPNIRSEHGQRGHLPRGRGGNKLV